MLNGCAVGYAVLPPRTGLPPGFFEKGAIVIKNDLYSYEAYIVSGSAFGVSIGEGRAQAREHMLKNSGIQEGVSSCNLPEGYASGREHNTVYITDAAIANCISNSWTDRFYANGAVTQGWIQLHSQDGLIDKIEWDASKR